MLEYVDGDQLTLYPPGNPSVSSVTPSSGPGVGGTAVVITGQNLGCVTGVFFGSVEATQFTNEPGPLDCGSTTAVDATAPPGTVGTTVPVKVTTAESDDTGFGESPSTAKFTYTTNPAAPTATPSPTSLFFGTVTVGSTTGSKSLSITDSGAGQPDDQHGDDHGRDTSTTSCSLPTVARRPRSPTGDALHHHGVASRPPASARGPPRSRCRATILTRHC